MPKTVVATCQFPVSADVDSNVRFVTRQMRDSRRRGARVAHFPEGALSGYAGVDFRSFDGFDWPALDRAMEHVLDLARELRLWVVVGSAHRLSGRRKPHNSVYVVDDTGDVVERYDKRFCAGNEEGRSLDLEHYSAGNHPAMWRIDDIRCGALICYDFRFPELQREYKRHGVDLLFHSFHAGNVPPARVRAIGAAIGPRLRRLNAAATFTYPAITMPATMTATAASSHVWISCANSSARESLWPAFMVRADGVTVGRLRRNVAGVLISTVDTERALYDSTRAWRGRALRGVLHSGDLVRDPRSRDRRTL